MFRLVSTVALLLILTNGDSPARHDAYTSGLNGLVTTKRPTSRPRMARSDSYTSRATSQYAKAMKSDGYFGFLRRFTKRPTSRYIAAIKTDRYTSRPTSQHVRMTVLGDGYRLTRRPTSKYPEAVKSDDFTRYFRRYFTKRPTSRYNGAARSDLRTRRPTRRYAVQGDVRTLRPTSRGYGAEARNDMITRRPTRQKYVAEFVNADVEKDEEAKQVDKISNGAQQMVPEAEVMDKKYFYAKSRLGWNDAQEACARRGAQLAMIHSMSEHERVGKVCQGECWLGADRSDVAASFKWSDDSAMDFEKWGYQPEPKSGLCAKMSKSAGKEWMSADCDQKLGFVCQKMQWNAQLKASVESDSLSFATSFAQGNILSLAVMIVAVIVVGFLGCNHVCMVANEKKCGTPGNQGGDRTDGMNDEKTPLLWTRA